MPYLNSSLRPTRVKIGHLPQLQFRSEEHTSELQSHHDLVMITADHGNDPTFRGTDHTREFAPLIVFGKRAKPGVNLGTRSSLADIGKTIADNFGLHLPAGYGFLTDIIGN